MACSNVSHRTLHYNFKRVINELYLCIMNEFAPITEYVSHYVNLTKDESDYFVSLLRIKKVKRKQFIVQPDFICQERSYVVQGALRSYLIGSNGKEHTVTLAIENYWISDLSSFIFQEPATLFVEALEDSKLIQLSYTNEQMLLKNVPNFERFFRITSQNTAAAFQKRTLSGLSMTAEERYYEFLNKFPNLLSRFPQYIIASYLGVTTQFLSKIRNQKANS